ncbi:MAG: hypothetical protein KGH98_01745 [Candidatus Micrarchaeota archaeon]|nr:hypothetical protein [Candidatus Micrarchaeota archaeon]
MIPTTEFRIDTVFSPDTIKAYTKNEVSMTIRITSGDKERSHWCECEVKANPPLSLARDAELGLGKAKVGIVKPSGSIEKRINLYTKNNNYPDEYSLKITAFIYDEDGAIAERIEQNASIQCKEQQVDPAVQQ